MTVNISKNAQAYDWATWLIGIARSFISGGAGAVAGMLGPMVTDSKDFNLGAGLTHLLECMAISFLVVGIAHLMMFLQTHSVPDLIPVVPVDQKE